MFDHFNGHEIHCLSKGIRFTVMKNIYKKKELEFSLGGIFLPVLLAGKFLEMQHFHWVNYGSNTCS